MSCPLRILFIAIIQFLGFVNIIYGQEGSIRGRVVDSMEGKGIPLAVVLVLRLDSTIEQRARTREDGQFKFEQIPAGRYLVMITHPHFPAYSQLVTVVVKNSADLGNIRLAPKADSLAPVTVTPGSPVMHLKGDTLEYSTAGIKMKANATVEELLIRMPGIQVNADGSITVNGQKIDKLLVDGEDIFGSDPKNVTRNFNSDLFSKVQILDKKSDQAAFTGIEDGKTTHTLNLVMKEEGKKNYFGKVEAGAGTGSYYNNTGLLGSFKGKRQFAGLGLVSNTGTTSFSGSGGGNEVANIAVSGGVDDGLAASAGTGVPRATGAGVHYSDKWDNMGEHLSGNYSYGHTLAYPITSSITQQLLPDTVYLQNQNSHSVNAADEHSFSGMYDLKPDTLSSLHFALNGRSVASNNQFNSLVSTYLNDTIVNQGNRKVSSKALNQSVSGSIYWNRKLGNKGGLLSVTADIGTSRNNSSGYVFAANQYFHSPGMADTTDQKKQIKASGLSAEGSISFLKSLNPTTAISLSYGISSSSGKTRFDTYNRGAGKYTDKVDSLSVDFEPGILSQIGTVTLTWKNKRVLLTTAADITHYNITEANPFPNRKVSNSYQFVSPHVFGHYKFNDAHIVYFSYTALPQLPNFAQLQPLKNNTDPLHIVVGNSQLKPTLIHTFSLRVFRVKPGPINIEIQTSFLENDIANRSYTDSLGRQIAQAVNINGNKNVSSYFVYNKKILPAALDARVNFRASYGRSNTFVNNVFSRNDAYNFNGHLSLGKFIAGKYEIQASSEINYSLSRSSINAMQTNYWTQNHTVLIDLELPGGFEWSTSCSLTILQKITAFSGISHRMKWDSYINKNFLSGKVSVKLSGNDLVGQKTDISRSIAGNQIVESNTNIVTGRYVLLTVTYHFSAKKGQ
jgi:hypothetical protein